MPKSSDSVGKVSTGQIVLADKKSMLACAEEQPAGEPIRVAPGVTVSQPMVMDREKAVDKGLNMMSERKAKAQRGELGEECTS